MSFFHFIYLFIFYFSVPTFQGLPEETLSKIADVLEEVSRCLLFDSSSKFFIEEKV